jgi:hypothetical protein
MPSGAFSCGTPVGARLAFMTPRRCLSGNEHIGICGRSWSKDALDRKFSLAEIQCETASSQS